MTTLNGTCLIGRFVGVEPVKYGMANPDESKRGEPVPGMFSVLVGEPDQYGELQTTKATFFAQSYEGPTRIARELDEGEFKPGDRVAVKVVPRTSANSSFINYDGKAIEKLDDVVGEGLRSVG